MGQRATQRSATRSEGFNSWQRQMSARSRGQGSDAHTRRARVIDGDAKQCGNNSGVAAPRHAAARPQRRRCPQHATKWRTAQNSTHLQHLALVLRLRKAGSQALTEVLLSGAHVLLFLHTRRQQPHSHAIAVEATRRGNAERDIGVAGDASTWARRHHYGARGGSAPRQQHAGDDNRRHARRRWARTNHGSKSCTGGTVSAPMRAVLAAVVAVAVVAAVAAADCKAISRGWGDGIAWTSFREGVRQAKESNKLMMLVVHQEWCGECLWCGAALRVVSCDRAWCTAGRVVVCVPGGNGVSSCVRLGGATSQARASVSLPRSPAARASRR
jgi:hypothetical protein